VSKKGRFGAKVGIKENYRFTVYFLFSEKEK
jgi:hypothetical protein